jgi:hypothetical protein
MVRTSQDWHPMDSTLQNKISLINQRLDPLANMEEALG